MLALIGGFFAFLIECWDWRNGLRGHIKNRIHSGFDMRTIRVPSVCYGVGMSDFCQHLLVLLYVGAFSNAALVL